MQNQVIRIPGNIRLDTLLNSATCCKGQKMKISDKRIFKVAHYCSRFRWTANIKVDATIQLQTAWKERQYNGYKNALQIDDMHAGELLNKLFFSGKMKSGLSSVFSQISKFYLI